MGPSNLIGGIYPGGFQRFTPELAPVSGHQCACWFTSTHRRRDDLRRELAHFLLAPPAAPGLGRTPVLAEAPAAARRGRAPARTARAGPVGGIGLPPRLWPQSRPRTRGLRTPPLYRPPRASAHHARRRRLLPERSRRLVVRGRGHAALCPAPAHSGAAEEAAGSGA